VIEVARLGHAFEFDHDHAIGIECALERPGPRTRDDIAPARRLYCRPGQGRVLLEALGIAALHLDVDVAAPPVAGSLSIVVPVARAADGRPPTEATLDDARRGTN
jgi:hypothetical protein